MKMIQRVVSLSMLLLFVVAVGVSAQAEHLKTDAATSVSVGRGRPMADSSDTGALITAMAQHGSSITERSVVVNTVEIVVRHCQKYEKNPSALGKFLLGKKRGIDERACAEDPSTIFYTHKDHNLRTTAGGDWQASVMGNTSAPPATMNYIALSNDATAPAVGDTVVAGEISSNGLSRAQGVYAHTGGTASFTIQKVFSATGTQASQKAGLLNASSSGTLGFENTYTSVTVNNGDTLTVTWTINY